mgnify:CR=1 FL=1
MPPHRADISASTEVTLQRPVQAKHWVMSATVVALRGISSETATVSQGVQSACSWMVVMRAI